MSEIKLEKEGGLFSTVLPVFSDNLWPHIVPATGFVWIGDVLVDFSGKIDSVASLEIFGTADIDVECTIHRMDIDVSIPSHEFLSRVGTVFPHGLDFIQSEKHQPSGFHLNSIPRSIWPNVMAKNQINVVFHRPARGEPSLLTSHRKEVLVQIVERFQ